jgi:protein gp37
MSENSKIEWTDASWTPVRARRKDNGKVGVACVKVSPACKNCYAERFNMRNLPVHGTGLPYTVEALDQVEIFLDEEMLLVPLKWKKPRKIFVCSQTDLFGEFVPDEMIDRVFAVMALCPQHTFQVLTKRAARMYGYLNCDVEDRLDDICHMLPGAQDETWHYPAQWPLPNVWLGVTAEDQQRADERIPHLLRTPAEKRFVSVEPMLGPVDLTNLSVHEQGGTEQWNSLDRSEAGDAEIEGACSSVIDWVIGGGESGPGARAIQYLS